MRCNSSLIHRRCNLHAMDSRAWKSFNKRWKSLPLSTRSFKLFTSSASFSQLPNCPSCVLLKVDRSCSTFVTPWPKTAHFYILFLSLTQLRFTLRHVHTSVPIERVSHCSFLHLTIKTNKDSCEKTNLPAAKNFCWQCFGSWNSLVILCFIASIGIS